MNLRMFLDKVDKLTDELSKEDLQYFIHDCARILQDTERNSFLDRLEGMCKDYSIVKIDSDLKEIQHGKYLSLKEKLLKINSGELCLEAILNEEYDDWYNDSGDEFFYKDNQGIILIVEEAFIFVQECIDSENYQEGYEIVELLVKLVINVDNEYGDEQFTIKDLYYYDLSQMDINKFYENALFLAYLGNDLSKRCEAVFMIFEYSQSMNLTLEKIMQKEIELIDFDKFIFMWIDYLGIQIIPAAQSLIKEALELLNDAKKQLEYTRKYYSYHPALYQYYLEMYLNKEDKKTLFTIAKEALDNLDKKYLIRSEIAILASQIAIDLDMTDERNKCWFEAFRSNTNVVNYLRIANESDVYLQVKEELRSIYSSVKQVGFSSSFKDERTENEITNETLSMLKFLDGNFQEVIDQTMNVKESLGWSMTFMKCGIAAFGLLLYKNEDLKSGCKYVCDELVSKIDFSSSDYQKGMNRIIFETDDEFFWQCFKKWKQSIKLSDKQKNQFLTMLEELVSRRVEAIMERNLRNYYNECAAYVAMLGEIKESQGLVNGKQKVMLEYQELYSRRTAFHRELRSYR